MISSCTHCGVQYQLPAKMLGKQARCKACKRLFLIAPTEDEVDLPQPTGSTAQMSPVSSEQATGDGLDALASAAAESSRGMAPVRSAPARRNDDYNQEHQGRQRMAKGAQSAMVMGIIACVFTVAGIVLMTIAMVNGDDQSLLVTLGIITLGLLTISAVCAMVAVVNGTSAAKKIRRARHPLGGRSQASAGSLTGSIALGLVVIAFIIIGIWLARRGGITFEKEIVAPDNASVAITQDLA